MSGCDGVERVCTALAAPAKALTPLQWAGLRAPGAAVTPGNGPMSAAGRWRHTAVVLFLALTACQPEARRALVLDLTLSDAVVLSSTAKPWRDAGYVFEYRQFYSHLVRAHLSRDHTLIFLLGRASEAPSDPLTAGGPPPPHQ